MKRAKIYYVLRVLLSAFGGVALGIFVLWADAYAVEVFDVLLIAMGLLVAVFNIPDIVLSVIGLAKKRRAAWLPLLPAVLSIVFGVIFMFITRTSPYLPVLLGIYIILLPLARVLLVSSIKRIAQELPKILCGAFLLMVTMTKSEDTMFWVFGIGIFVVSGLYLVMKLMALPKLATSYESKIDT